MPGFENQQSYVQENHRAKGNGDSDLKELAHRLILRCTQCKSSSLTRTKAIHEGDRSHCSWVFPVWAVHTCWFWETMGARAYAAAGMVTGVMHGVRCLPATSGGSRQQHGEGGVRRLG